MNVHICIISQQLLANYLPIKLDCPDAVLAINTAFTQRQGLDNRFERLLKDSGVEIRTASQLAPDDDYSSLEEYFLALEEELSSLHADKVTLNLTGGTKLMSLAAFEILGSSCDEIIYTNTQTDQLLELKNRTSRPLPSLLSIDEYLLAYGVEAKSYSSGSDDWCASVQARKSLTKSLAKYFSVSKHRGFLPVLNAVANDAIESRWEGQSKKLVLGRAKQQFKRLFPEQKALLRESEAHDLLHYDGDKGVEFLSVEAAQYLGGFWVEEYAYHIACDAGADEVRCGQTVNWDKQTRNELDLVVLHNNRLLIVECKAQNVKGDIKKTNEILYKLDSIGEDLKGLYGEKWLLSVRSFDDNQLKRAKSSGVKVVSLEDFKSQLEQWLGNK